MIREMYVCLSDLTKLINKGILPNLKGVAKLNLPKSKHLLRMARKTDTVEMTKERLSEDLGIPTSMMILTYKKDIMSDQYDLRHYNVKNNVFGYVELELIACFWTPK